MNEKASPNPFADIEDVPYLQLFIDAAFVAHQSTGKWLIPGQKRREIMASLGLSEGETAACVYLGQNRAQEIDEIFDDEELTSRIIGDSQ